MHFDWVTWSIWSIGALILILWSIETYKEFKSLFTAHKGQEKQDGKGR